MLVCPAPLPDELDRGYLGRVMRLNGIKHEPLMHILLCENFGLKQFSKSCSTPVEVLSLVAGMSTEQFVQQHSTMPLRRALTMSRPKAAHGDKESHSLLRSSAMRMIGTCAYFCEECSMADVAFHGMAYWRRSLQVPGRIWCDKHAIPLMRAPPIALFESPVDWIEKGTEPPARLVSTAISNKTVRRYLCLADELLGRSLPTTAKTIRAKLLSRASLVKVLSFPTFKSGRSEFLLHVVEKKFPASWLSFLGNDVEDLHIQAFPHWFDRLDHFYASLPPWPYLLLASALYDDTETMLHAWSDSSSLQNGYASKAKMALMESRFQPSQISA